MCRTTSMPSGIRLQQLIQNRYKEILAREKNNDKFIHLYDIGAYWVAFERSACRLSGLFSKSELTLFRVPDCVEYVVMVSVPADEAEGCLGEYIILHDGIYRKVWSDHIADGFIGSRVRVAVVDLTLRRAFILVFCDPVNDIFHVRHLTD